MVVVRILDIEIDDGHTGLEHLGGVAERLRCGRAEAGGEAVVAGAVGDMEAVEVEDIAETAVDGRRYVLVAEKRKEPVIAARFVVEHIGPRVC